jgi:hypothetical protein
MRRILIISYFANRTDPQSILINRYIEELSKFIEIDLITAFSSNNELNSKCNEHAVFHKQKSLDLFLSKYICNTFDFFWRLRVYNFFLKKLKDRNYFIVLGFSEPLSSSIIANKIAKHIGIESINWLSDPLQSVVSLKFKNPLKLFSYYFIENKVIKETNKIIVVNKETAISLAVVMKVDLNIIYVIEHAYKPVKVLNNFQSERIVINHIGNLYHTRDPLKVLEIFDKIYYENSMQIKVNFIGNIDQRFVKSIVSRSYCEIISSVSYNQSLNYFNECDYTLVIDMSDSLGLFTASKIMDSLSVNRNFISLGKRNSALERITNYLGGFFINKDDDILVKDVIDFLVARKSLIQENILEYHVKNQISKLLNILNK